MPRFFFDARPDDSSDVIRDVRGCDLPDAESARIEATEFWKSIRKTANFDPLTLRVEVADAVGNILFKDIRSDFFELSWASQAV